MDERRRRVLVVDDDSELRRVLAARFTWAGYSVDDVPDGRRAIQHCVSQPPDVMILDVALPDTDGYRVCRMLRRMLMNETTTVVFLSGAAEPPRPVGALDALLDDVGGQFFLRKPCDARRLISLMDSVTNRRLGAAEQWQAATSFN